jgi:DNA-binding transcriptional LysR family regulator
VETNDGALARAWTLAGYGIARKTIWDAAADRAGKLQVVLPDWIESEPGIYAVLNRNRYMTPRVSATGLPGRALPTCDI